MFAVEVYAAVRRFVFLEGRSRREAARVFGLSRETVLKMCRFSLPPNQTCGFPASGFPTGFTVRPTTAVQRRGAEFSKDGIAGESACPAAGFLVRRLRKCRTRSQTWWSIAR